MTDTTTPGAGSTSKRSTTRRPAVIGLMVVALTAGMLALAGTTPRGIGAPVDEVSRVSLDQRTFVCDAKIPGTEVRRGTIVSGPGQTEKASAPVIVNVDRELARGAFVAQQAASPRWYAWLPCPEAHARWWFVGAGGASVTHATVLTITNPRTGTAVLDIDVYGPSGVVDAPGLHGKTLAGGATETIDLATVAASVGELAVNVNARRGLVTVSASDTFSPGSVGKIVREWIPATTPPAKVTTLAGLPSTPSGATLLLMNPGEIETVAQVEVIGSGGTFEPEGIVEVTVPPKAVKPVALSTVFDGKPLALRVTGSGPLTATVRSSREGDIAFAAGVRPIRGATAIAIPTGTGRQLVLSSTGKAGSVSLVGYDAKAQRILQRTINIPAAASVGVKLGVKLSYLRLASNSANIVGGLSANGTPGLVTAGVSPAIRSIRLPVVRLGW